MVFLHPERFLWLLLALPLVAMYLIDRPRRRVVIATAWLWREIVPADRGFSRWVRWRRPISLGVHLLVLGMLVTAMAEPSSRRPEHLVLLVDPALGESVGPDALDRFDSLKRLARQRIEAMQSGDFMALVVAGQPVEVRCGWTDRPEELARALERIAPRSEASRWARSVAVARQMLAFNPGSRLLVFSAAPAPDDALGAAEVVETDEVEWIEPGQPAEQQHHAEVPSWRVWACIALLAIALEWWVYQRRWTC